MELKEVYANIQYTYNMFASEYDMLNPRFWLNDRNQISWIGHMSNEKFETYEEYYFWALENVQYSFSFGDDSLVQLFFEGETKGKKIEVIKASMSFLPNPYTYSDYFRFDMDLKNEVDFEHASYHAHFGYRSKNVRFTIYKYPMPSEFVKLVRFLNYNTAIESFSESKFWEDLNERGIKFNHALDFM